MNRNETLCQHPLDIEERGQKMRYTHMERYGKVVSAEIEDANQVDSRRAAIGLGPIAEYLTSMNEE